MKFSHLILALLPALISVESGGDWSKVGAAGERGGLQITSDCIADVNAHYGTHFTQDDAYDPVQAKAICVSYLTYWGEQFREREGRGPTLEDLARIWNKGPRGYRDPRSLPYWAKVRAYLNAAR